MDTQARYSFQLFLVNAAVMATLGLATLPAWGELPPLIPREVLFGNPVKTEAQDLAQRQDTRLSGPRR